MGIIARLSYANAYIYGLDCDGLFSLHMCILPLRRTPEPIADPRALPTLALLQSMIERLEAMIESLEAHRRAEALHAAARS